MKSVKKDQITELKDKLKQIEEQLDIIYDQFITSDINKHMYEDAEAVLLHERSFVIKSIHEYEDLIGY
jgi:hypothetical protein